MIHKQVKTIAAAAIAALAAGAALAQDGAPASLEDIAPYPAAGQGTLRHVIFLPQQPDEGLFRVELVAGKVMPVDCNRVIMAGQLDVKTLEGWGYDYLVVDSVSVPATTMMACPDDSKEDRFVAMNLGDAAMQRYNSKLPIVVYAPEGVDVKYRIWQTDDLLTDAAVQ